MSGGDASSQSNRGEERGTRPRWGACGQGRRAARTGHDTGMAGGRRVVKRGFPCVLVIVGRSRGRFLGWASKPRSSRDYVGAKSWVVIGGGYTEFARFVVVHQKTTGLLGWAKKPRLKTRRGGAATQAGLTAQEGRSDRLAGLTAQGGGLTALVAGAEKIRSGGHTSGSQGLRRG
jgi:hypothetical protein